MKGTVKLESRSYVLKNMAQMRGLLASGNPSASLMVKRSINYVIITIIESFRAITHVYQVKNVVFYMENVLLAELRIKIITDYKVNSGKIINSPP